MAIREHTTLDASEPLRRGNHSHVLATPQAMAARFADHPEAVAETARLAERLNFDLLEDLGYRYPGSEDPTPPRRLAELCAARLRTATRPATAPRAEAAARLEEELRLIDRLDLAGFFLLHHDLLELAREVAVEVRGADTARALLPPGRGRGSSGPVDRLLPHRPLARRPDRATSSCSGASSTTRSRRCPTSTSTSRATSARSCSRACTSATGASARPSSPPSRPTARAARSASWARRSGCRPGKSRESRVGRRVLGKDVEGDIAAAYGEEKRPGGRWGWLSWLAAQAMGLPRHLSQHPGGMVVATRPLIDCCPAVPAAMAGRQMIQWDKDSCGDAGFLKIDLLGLGMLSAVERCVEEIARTRNERIDLSRIPYDDPATYAAIQEADTVGVFQIESRAQMAVAAPDAPGEPRRPHDPGRDRAPRPDPGRRGQPVHRAPPAPARGPGFEIPYDHPSLEPVLQDTLGTIIFQDQVIEVAMAFAGFSPGEAEGLRRAMSRRRSEAAMEAYHRRFVAGRSGAPRRRRGARRARVGHGQGLLGLRLPQGPRRRLRPARLPVDLAARALRPRVPVPRCSTSSRWASTRPTRSPTRPSAAGSSVLPADVNAARRECTVEVGGNGEAPRVRLGLGYVTRRCGARTSRRSWPRASAPAVPPRRATSPPARGSGAPAWSAGLGRRVRRAGAATAARRCGSSASPRRASGWTAAPSSRCRSTLPAAPAPARARATGSRCWPTTGPPA